MKIDILQMGRGPRDEEEKAGEDKGMKKRIKMCDVMYQLPRRNMIIMYYKNVLIKKKTERKKRD